MRANCKILLTLLTILLFSSLLFGQRQAVKILDVTVEGAETIDPAMVRLNSGLTPGTEITGETIQDAIKQLWRLGLFSDIQVVVDKELDTGVYLTIKVAEYPRLDKIELSGNKKIKTKDIEENLNFYSGQVVNPSILARARTKIYEQYKEKGYLLATINTSEYPSQTDTNRVVVRFFFDEGKKVQVERINFFGNSAFPDKKLKKQFKEVKEDRWWRGADFDYDEYNEDLGNLIAFYQNEGYRNAEVIKDSIYYNQDQDDMFIDIWVAEGKQFIFGDFTWEGNTLFSNEELSVNLRFEPGEVYSKRKIDEAIYQHLGSMYYDRGYIYSSIIPQEIVDPENDKKLNLHFYVNEGNQAKIDEIRITGNTKTKEKVIRRELRIYPGDTFNRSLLERSQREVWMLNYFANVEPQVIPASGDKVDLAFQVEEKSTDTANMSAGWSERDRLIGSVGVGMANLFGNGQRLNFNWSFGQYYRSFSISFTEPWVLDTPTLGGLSFYDTKRDAYYYGYKQQSRGGSVRLGRRLNWPDNFFRVDWIYQYDETTLSNFNSYYIETDPNGITSYDWPLTSSGVTQIISRNSLDRPEFPSNGSEVSLTTEFAGSVLGGNVSYQKHIFQLDWFQPSFWKLVLYTGFQAGYMESFNNTNIPYQEYFFMGGDGLSQSIPLRGYNDPLSGYRNIAEGGKAMLKYVAEIRIPIAPNPTIFALAFAEAGEVWPSFRYADPFAMRRSAGIGARVFMPMIGIIGFDYGYGFDQVDEYGNPDPKWKWHFVFGRSY